MDTAAEQAGRGTFLRIIWKFAHFGSTIRENLAQDNGVLKVLYVIKVKSFLRCKSGQNFPKFS